MASTTTKTKITLWIWPSGLFPRRLIYYFRAKSITLSTLTSHNIHLIPVELVPSPPTLQSKPGYEPQPADTSLPVMRIENFDGTTVWIRESLSILEYFEELFPSSAGFRNLRGVTMEHRAQTRDMLCLLSEAMHWSLVLMIHTNPQTNFFSGLTEDQMSASAAVNAKEKSRFLLGRLERWVEDSVSQRTVEHATLAGLVLLAQVEYGEMFYEADWVADHGVLRAWVEEMKSEMWYVGSDQLKKVEESGEWSLLLVE
jgi:glutathione S-transferase